MPSSDISRSFPRLGDSIIGNIIQRYQCSRYLNVSLQDEMDADLKQIPDLDMEKPPAGMRLLTGYAGEGMAQLTALNQTNVSWMQLL